MNKKRKHVNEEEEEEEEMFGRKEKKQKLDLLEGQLNALGVDKGKLEEDLRKVQELLHKLQDEKKDPDLGAYTVAKKEVEIAEKKVEIARNHDRNVLNDEDCHFLPQQYIEYK